MWCPRKIPDISKYPVLTEVVFTKNSRNQLVPSIKEMVFERKKNEKKSKKWVLAEMISSHLAVINELSLEMRWPG